MSHDAPTTPTQTVAKRVRELRKRHGWSASQLAERLAALGLPWDRFTVQNLENGRRRNITLDESVALAYALDVAPVHLMVSPADEHREYFIAPELFTVANQAREWFRGRSPIPGQDPRMYFSEVPAREWEPPHYPPEVIDFMSEQVRKARDDGQRQ